MRPARLDMGGIMRRRDFCKLAAGAAGLLTLDPLWAVKAAWGKSDAWTTWFCENAPPAPPVFDLTDAHFHFYDFVARTDGASALLEVMNRNKVGHIMFSGMPLVKKWNQDDHRAPAYYLDNNGRAYWYSATDPLLARTVLTKIPEKDRPRFHPFICGFNATDMYAADHVERMLDEYGDFWHGVGEVFGHRDDLTNMTYGETAQADHPALMRVYELAGRRDLPVCLHNNVSSRGRASDLLYWEEVETAVSQNPDTRFIWAHAGLSRYFEEIDQPDYTARLSALLARHHNLHLDLSWLVFEDYICPYPEKGPLTCWLDLIQAFPARFMIGTDCIGHFNDEKLKCPGKPPSPQGMKYAFNIRKYWVLLEKLSPDNARLVGRDSFLKILPARVRSGLDA